MSFQIVLQQNKSPENMVDKDVTDILTVTGFLRNGESISDPVISVETELTPQIVSQINYAKIEVFGRYYYVTDIRSEVNKLWTISLHVDVLMSYRDVIRQQEAIVSRQANNWNVYLDDGWFMAYQNPKHRIVPFPNTGAFNYQEFILVVAGS